MNDLTGSLPQGTSHTNTVRGGDAKYGRLFTEEDVATILTEVAEEGVTVAEAIRQLEGSLRFPADEPLFLLRGQDVHALEAIEAYDTAIGAVADPDVDDAHRMKVGDSIVLFRHFANAHPDRMKTPDS